MIYYKCTDIITFIYLQRRCYYKDTVSMFIYKLTAILIIIDARYHDFNSFPVVNWYYKPLKADNGCQLF